MRQLRQFDHLILASRAELRLAIPLDLEPLSSGT